MDAFQLSFLFSNLSEVFDTFDFFISSDKIQHWERNVCILDLITHNNFYLIICKVARFFNENIQS